MFVVDTNILIYAANESCPEHARGRERLQRWRLHPSAWFVTWGISCGFICVVTHPRVLPHPWPVTSAWRFVEALIVSPGLGILTETKLHDDVCTEVAKEIPQVAGNFIADLHIGVLMREHGVKVICTRDADFHRFPFLEVRDPLQTTV